MRNVSPAITAFPSASASSGLKQTHHSQRCSNIYFLFGHFVIQVDSKLLSGYSFTGHGNPDTNLESLCILVYKGRGMKHLSESRLRCASKRVLFQVIFYLHMILSGVCVIINGIWIRNWIYYYDYSLILSLGNPNIPQ
jgi:hypothetical protein